MDVERAAAHLHAMIDGKKHQVRAASAWAERRDRFCSDRCSVTMTFLKNYYESAGISSGANN